MILADILYVSYLLTYIILYNWSWSKTYIQMTITILLLLLITFLT